METWILTYGYCGVVSYVMNIKNDFFMRGSAIKGRYFFNEYYPLKANTLMLLYKIKRSIKKTCPLYGDMHINNYIY